VPDLGENAFVLSHNDYHYKHEPILYGWNDGAAHEWFGDRSQTSILECDRPQKNDLHPTMKPVEMLTYLMGNSSKRNGIVLDTFGGSGSTLIAAERIGRKCRMLELDEKYCDVIRHRWAEFKHGEDCDWQKLTPVIANERKQ
jgi:site-specific DNA-methyltransferase (adenine-specific)